jgi:hypothetical protein
VIDFPFIGPAYTGRSANYSSQRTVNLYLEGGKGKAPGLLIGSPGLTAPWVTLTGGGMRGMYGVDADTSVMVCGGNVYKVTHAGVATNIGSMPDDGRPVQITGNGVGDIVICSSGGLYSLTLTGTTSSFITTTGYPISSVDYINGHFVATEHNRDWYTWSDILEVGDTVQDGFALTHTQEVNGSADVLVGLKIARKTMYFFGSKSLEQWYDAGTTPNPFTPISGAFFEIGCIAKDSIAEMDTVFWLSGDDKGAGSVWTIQGGAPKRISTPAIEYAINQWPDMSDAYAFTYSQENHAFYVLSSVSGNETWVYDISTDEWHQRAYLHASGELHRIRPACHLYFADKHLVGDWENGNVYEYSLNAYSDNGNPLPAIRACGTLQSDLSEQRNLSLRLDMDTGVGLTTGQGSDPQAMLRWSKDGGKTWSNALWRSFGKIGEYSRRCWWHRVGGGERSVFEVTITDPVKRAITGAYLGRPQL